MYERFILCSSGKNAGIFPAQLVFESKKNYFARIVRYFMYGEDKIQSKEHHVQQQGANLGKNKFHSLFSRKRKSKST